MRDNKEREINLRNASNALLPMMWAQNFDEETLNVVIKNNGLSHADGPDIYRRTMKILLQEIDKKAPILGFRQAVDRVCLGLHTDISFVELKADVILRKLGLK